MKILAKDLNKYYDKEITFEGFVDNIRDLQWVMFIILRDSTGKLQVTIEKSEESNKNLLDIMSNVTNESTLKIKGILKENTKVKLNGMELIPSDITITSLSEKELPINYNDPENINLDTRLDYRFLDLRGDKLKNNLIFFFLFSILLS